MPTHISPRARKEKNGPILWEFFMLFLAVFAGFLAENKREHIVEKNRARQFLQSMLLDVQTNMKNPDSLMQQDNAIISNHGKLEKWLLADSASIDRAAFARSVGKKFFSEKRNP